MAEAAEDIPSMGNLAVVEQAAEVDIFPRMASLPRLQVQQSLSPSAAVALEQLI